MATAMIVLVTTPDEALARRIARALVEGRLAACGQVIPGLTSIYRWQGVIHEEPELLLVLKTRSSLLDRVEARIKALHPYEVPQIAAFPITRGSPEYLAWLAEQTGGESAREGVVEGRAQKPPTC